MRERKYIIKQRIYIIILMSLLVGCGRGYVPKPHGYLKVNYPEKNYTTFDSAAPFTFEYPVYAKIQVPDSKNKESYWYNVYFPDFKGTIYLSYLKVENNLDEIIGDTRTLVYKHSYRSDGITETPYMDPEDRKYGLLYELQGDAASSVQFFLTDSTTNFLRGSLYFDTEPKRDSLNPVIDFVTEDIVHMIESLSWKY